jgi:hypothetical protein
MGHGIFVAAPLTIALVLGCPCGSVGEGVVCLIHKAALGAGTGMLLGRIFAERDALETLLNDPDRERFPLT